MTAGKSIAVTAARRLLIVLGLVPIPLVSGILVLYSVAVLKIWPAFDMWVMMLKPSCFAQIIHSVLACCVMCLWEYRHNAGRSVSPVILVAALYGLLSNCLLRSYVLVGPVACLTSALDGTFVIEMIPCFLYWALFVTLGIALVAKERLLTDKGTSSTINLVCVVFNMIVAGISLALSFYYH